MAQKKPLDRSKPPPGFKCRLGAPIGWGRYNSKIVAADGFTWRPEATSRNDLLRLAWAHYDRAQATPKPCSLPDETPRTPR